MLERRILSADGLHNSSAIINLPEETFAKHPLLPDLGVRLKF